MLTTNKARLSNKAKHCSSYSDQPCRLIPTIQLPEELVYEVLLRLPVKSLIRFRCVSKGMYGMIDSSNFGKNHNNHRFVISERDRSLSDDDYSVVLYQPGRYTRLFSVNFDKHNNLNRAKAIELNCTFAKEGMIPVGWCCNGIFCFKNRDPDPTSYVFWNPCNGTFRKVNCSSCVISANVSMGYDYVNDDYKIIRVIDITTETSMEVYSFRKDSWRKFHKDFPEGSIYCPTRAVCLSGVMHWLWTIRTDKSVFIAAFDLATETFTSLPLPLEARQHQLQPFHFTDFGGRLCVAFYPPGYSGAQTVWVMETYGVESCWTKLYSFDRTCTPRILSFYFPNSERRLLCNFKGLTWYDPEDDTFERIQFTGPSYDRRNCTQAYIYVRNLVRLDQSWEPPR